jgi:hypothetical protein
MLMQRRPRKEDSKHLRFVRERPCVICGFTPCDPAHIKMGDSRISKPPSSNLGMKADDRFTLPLCRKHHERQHQMPEREFWEYYRLDAVLLALALFSISGDEQEGDRLITNAMVSHQILGGKE